MGRLEHKVAIVTGGARGIGRGIAGVFAAEGATVVVADVDGELAAEVAAGLGHGAIGLAVDVRDRDQVQAMADATLAAHGRIDVLVQNVGIYPAASIEDTDAVLWDHVHAVNTRSLLFTVQACLPPMKAAGGGRITVTSSITGNRVGIPNLSHYASSKAAINGFIRAAAIELAPHGITINGVEPGTVLTEGLRDEWAPDVIASWSKAIPLGRLATPEDIAHAHAFLASDQASYITGQTIVVDGGQILPETPLP